MRKLKDMQVGQTAAAKTGESKTETVKSKIFQDNQDKTLQILLEEQECNIRHLLDDNTEMQTTLHKYQDQLRGWKVNHNQQLNNIVERNKAALKVLETMDARVTDKLSKCKESRQQLEVLLGNVRDGLSKVEESRKQVEAVLGMSATAIAVGSAVDAQNGSQKRPEFTQAAEKCVHNSAQVIP